MKLALLSHLDGNIGHKFMALGFQHVLISAFGPNAEIEFVPQHKHFSLYPKNHFLHLVDRLSHGKGQLIRRTLNIGLVREWLYSQLERQNYNAAIACGGPNIVPTSLLSPEMGLLLHNLNGAFAHLDIPLMDLGVGSCFPLASAETDVENLNKPFYRKAFSLPKKIGVRDVLAKEIVNSLGFSCELIPCGAFCMGEIFETFADNSGGPADKYIIVNYQKHGANSNWGRRIVSSEWLAQVRLVISHFEGRYKVVFLAHSAEEYELASKTFPGFSVFQPADIREYGSIIRGASVAFVSRIHAAIPIASCGVPVVLAGADTRMGALQSIGIPTFDCGEVKSAEIVDKMEDLLLRKSDEKDRLLALREEVKDKYKNIIRENCR